MMLRSSEAAPAVTPPRFTVHAPDFRLSCSKSFLRAARWVRRIGLKTTGFSDGISGFELGVRMQQSAERFGAETRLTEVRAAELCSQRKGAAYCGRRRPRADGYSGNRCFSAGIGASGGTKSAWTRRFVLRDLRRNVLPRQRGGYCWRRRYRGRRCRFSFEVMPHGDACPPKRRASGVQGVSGSAFPVRESTICMECAGCLDFVRKHSDRRHASGSKDRQNTRTCL